MNQEPDHWLLREALPTDAEDICALHIDSIRRTCSSSYEESAIEAWVGEKEPSGYIRTMESGGKIFVMEEQAIPRLLGIGIIDVPESWIRAIHVTPSHLGKGIGRRILRRLEQAVREFGHTSIKVRSSLNAREFYEKNGYTPGEVSTRPLPGGLELYYVPMVKDLDVLDV